MSDLQPGTTMHRIGELERVTRDLRQDVRDLRGLLEAAERRIRGLEGQTPQARQLQMEADDEGGMSEHRYMTADIEEAS